MRAGFTLMELIVVFAILAVVFAFSLPIGLDSYRNYVLTSETRNLVSILRRAENLALANSGESPHGVSFQPAQFVLFRGPSYASRNQAFDEVYPRASLISTSGITEIVFTNVSGLPNGVGTMTLSNGFRSKEIAINAQGAFLW